MAECKCLFLGTTRKKDKYLKRILVGQDCKKNKNVKTCIEHFVKCKLGDNWKIRLYGINNRRVLSSVRWQNILSSCSSPYFNVRPPKPFLPLHGCPEIMTRPSTNYVLRWHGWEINNSVITLPCDRKVDGLTNGMILIPHCRLQCSPTGLLNALQCTYVTDDLLIYEGNYTHHLL